MKRMTALLAGAIAMMLATTAQALTLTLQSGAQTVVVADDNPGFDRDYDANSIYYKGNINGIAVNFATGSSHFNPSLGTFEISSYVFSGKGTISILLTESGLALTVPALDPNVRITQSLSESNSAGSAKVSGDVRINGQSVAGVAATQTGTGAVTSSGLATIGDTFTMEQLITLDLGLQGSTVSLGSTVQVAPVPEPGTMVLLGAGFLCLAIYGKRRKNA